MKISSPKAINWTLKQYGYSITNFTTVLLLFLTKKKLVESRRWKKFCPTKHFSGRVYLHNGQISLSVTRFPIFDPSVPTKIVLQVWFLERDFECAHSAEKSYWTKMGQKIHCVLAWELYRSSRSTRS
jgi:hypothetical protein